MKTGDVVRLRSGVVNVLGVDFKYGIVLDSHEDEYGILYYEVCWRQEIGWWHECELEMVSESR